MTGIKNKAIAYAVLGGACFAAGYYKGICQGQGTDMPTGIESLITYGTPLGGAVCGVAISRNIDPDGHSLVRNFDSLLGLSLGGAVGLGATLIGNLCGYFYSRVA